MKSMFITLMFLLMTRTIAFAQIPDAWIQYSVADTVDLSAEAYWAGFFSLALEDVGSVGDYKRLPQIVKTTPVVGDFSEVGHARRVHFDTEQTVLESIIAYEPGQYFAYELTEIELPLRVLAHRARGQWQYFPLEDGRTRIVWTYAFEQKNIFAGVLIRQYIRSTHRYWMRDTLTEMSRLIAKPELTVQP